MFYFIMPITQQTVGNQTINAPKYMQTDMAGAALSVVPYGAEGWGLVGLNAANPTLSAETDVYSFPADLTAAMADVSTLSTYLTDANVPTDQFLSGTTFADALQTLATIFLAAQAISGALGTAIFQDGSTTLDTAISDSSISALAPTLNLNTHGAGNLDNAGGSGGSSAPSSNGPFDFTGVAASDTVGATLDSLSQQFTSPVVL